ncbi:4-coumarate--CoA ligase 1 [Pseudolycoriella hygida]|uniref:Luciferin 4-monooxygenase n=1 Tax=Pseudolycoriella hygida TaxID=35572 RepID=A0A9Q0MKM7_9DIPT|nr:4-coumarate--CoA ligase 1 [Pseudolycoriella hygida]
MKSFRGAQKNMRNGEKLSKVDNFRDIVIIFEAVQTAPKMIRNATKWLTGPNLNGCRMLRNRLISTSSASTQKHKESKVPYNMRDSFRYSPEEGYVRTSSYNDVMLQNLTIDQYVWNDLNQFQDKCAIKCGETGRQYTYAQLRDHSLALAVRLQTQFGLKQGDVLAICLPNIPEFAIVALGTLEAGIIATTVNPIYTADEICKQLLDSGAKMIFGIPEIHSILQKAVAQTKKPIKIVTIKTSGNQTLPADAINFYELITNGNVDFSDLIKYDTSSNDTALLPYSSGTTGMSKGVMLTHENIVINCEQFHVPLPDTPLIPETTFDFQAVCPGVLPFFHIYGFTVCLMSKLKLRTKIISLPKFSPETFMKALVSEKGSILHLVPPIILFLGGHPSVTSKQLQNVQVVVSGAAPIGNLDAERLIQKSPQIEFLQGYGLTETSPALLMNVKGSTNFASCGGPVPQTEIKIVDINDPTFKGLGPNENGEVLARGPQIMKGYLNNKKATDETLLADNWMRTGDLGHYDEDGFFYVTDRLKELIKVKGFQVPPAELEEILRDHPKVVDAAVIGIPSTKHGELPHGYVVQKAGVQVTEKELQDYVAERVTAYKHLEGGITFVSQIPKNATGKILRRQLKEEYAKPKLDLKMIRQISKAVGPQLKRASFRSKSSTTLPSLSSFRTHTPEDGFVLSSIYEPISMPDLTVDQYVWKNISKWQNKVAIACGVTGRKYTYSKLRDHSAAMAVRLQKNFNLKRGDVVGICLPNVPEYPIALLGAAEAGLVTTTINPIYTPAEISRQLISSKPKLIFTLPSIYGNVQAAMEIARQDFKIVTLKTSKSESTPNGAVDFTELMSTKDVDFNSLDRHPLDIEDTFVLPYSSGTTGLPKGVMLSHLNITSNCEMLDSKLPDRRLMLPTTNDFQDVLPSVLPFFHIYGLVVSLISKLALGCKVVSLPKFDPDGFLTTLAEHKATYLNLVPPIVLFLANNDKATKRHLENVRTIMCGAAPLGASDIERFQQKAPHTEFMQGYGMTESSPLTLIAPKGCTNYASVGFVVSSGEAKIAKVDDPNFIGCDIDETGELLIRGCQVMKGYLNNPEATNETIVKGNWLRTGDLASYDSDGMFYIRDRLKELIKVKSFQVPPAELEEVLREHPNIDEAAVIGIPHELYGEVPRAFVVRKKATSVSEKELHEFVNERLSEYKRLRGGIQFVDSVPKNSTGKLLRRQLKELYC